MRLNLLIILIFLAGIFLKAQNSFNYFSPKVKSSVNNFTNADFSENPAKLTYSEDNSIYTSYSPSQFGLNEISPMTLNAVYSNDDLHYSLNINGLFDSKFNYSTYSALTSYKAFDKAVFGVSLKYHNVTIQNYNSHDLFTFDIGSILMLTDDLHFGFSLTNLTNSHFEGVDNTLQQSAIFGSELKINENTKVDMNAEIRLNSATSFNFGITRSIFELLDVRAAYATNPQIIDLNVNFNYPEDFSISYRLNYHNYLGMSHNIGVGYYF